MTPAILSATLSRLGLSRREAAALLGVSRRTVDGWCAGRFAVPGPVVRLLELRDFERVCKGPIDVQSDLRILAELSRP